MPVPVQMPLDHSMITLAEGGPHHEMAAHVFPWEVFRELEGRYEEARRKYNQRETKKRKGELKKKRGRPPPVRGNCLKRSHDQLGKQTHIRQNRLEETQYVVSS